MIDCQLFRCNRCGAMKAIQATPNRVVQTCDAHTHGRLNGRVTWECGGNMVFMGMAQSQS